MGELYDSKIYRQGARQLFAEDVAKLASTQDYEQLLDRYGVRRNAPWFWHVSDKFQKMYRQQASTAAGLFDYNRYHPR